MMIKAAFQGEAGAYSEQALFSYFQQQAHSIPCQSFADIFQKVYTGQAHYGVMPVENSLEGTVIPAYDELVYSDLNVIKELILPIHHCLLVNPGVTLEMLESVISHPQALGQCSNHLKALKLKPEPFLDTAGAAKYLQQHPCHTKAAIASYLAGQYYNLSILKEHFEDEHYNYTRFFVLGYDHTPYDKDGPFKTSVIFSGANKPKLLSMVLEQFAKYDINLTKIESRPTRNRAWEYVFFLDFEGHQKQNNIQSCLRKVADLTDYVNILGSYETIHY